jgi:hypothetical protein
VKKFSAQSKTLLRCKLFGCLVPLRSSSESSARATGKPLYGFIEVLNFLGAQPKHLFPQDQKKISPRKKDSPPEKKKFRAKNNMLPG